jgi:hypothetical protein
MPQCLNATLFACLTALALCLPAQARDAAAPSNSVQSTTTQSPQTVTLAADAANSPPDVQRMAQSGGLTREFFLGSWRTENFEFGNNVEIIWSLFRDGRLAYEFNVNGIWSRGSDGTWVFEGDVMTEHWIREDGSRGLGRGKVEKIDDNTISLTILDNGHEPYRGMVRISRRIGPPQLS